MLRPKPGALPLAKPYEVVSDSPPEWCWPRKASVSRQAAGAREATLCMPLRVRVTLHPLTVMRLSAAQPAELEQMIMKVQGMALSRAVSPISTPYFCRHDRDVSKGLQLDEYRADLSPKDGCAAQRAECPSKPSEWERQCAQRGASRAAISLL